MCAQDTVTTPARAPVRTVQRKGVLMSVITIAGQKGGSGKSNLVRNIACHFALDGYRVGIVDGDMGQQHSAAFFADRVNANGRDIWHARDDLPGLTVALWDRATNSAPDAAIIVAPDAGDKIIGDLVEAVAERTDVVVCDLPGIASVGMLEAIHYADLVLIPVQPSNDDLQSAHTTAGYVVRAGRSARRTIDYRLILSRASTGFRPEVERVVEEALVSADMPRIRAPVFERTAFKRASFTRIPPIIAEPTGGAAENMTRVYREIRDTLAGIVAAQTERVA